jgi:hypothetical protein
MIEIMKHKANKCKKNQTIARTASPSCFGDAEPYQSSLRAERSNPALAPSGLLRSARNDGFGTHQCTATTVPIRAFAQKDQADAPAQYKE